MKKELEAKGFEVFVPQFPKPEEPRIKNWVPKLAELVDIPDEHTYFVGHSIGCQTIARYLELLPTGLKVGGAVFVAGFFKKLTNLEDDDVVRSVAAEWLETPVDLKKVEERLGKSIAIFSDNDPYVPLDNKDDFSELLKSKIIIEHNQGHFSGKTGTTELPAALGAILEIIQNK